MRGEQVEIEGDAEQREEGMPSGRARRAVLDGHLHHRPRAPDEERREEPPLLPLRREPADDVRVHRPHPAADVADGRSELPTHERVEQGGRQPPAQPGPLPSLANPAGEIVATIEGREQRGDVLGEVLEVGVHAHRPLAAHEIESGAQRGLAAVVPLEGVGADPRLGGRAPTQDRVALVGGSVVHEDQLEGERQAPQHRERALDQLVEGRRIVVDRDDDGQVDLSRRSLPVHGNTACSA